MSEDRTITVMAVGDIMLGDSPKCIGIGIRSAVKKKGTHYIFADVKEYLQGDIVFGNLECVLSDHGYQGLSFEKAQMRGMPASIKALKDAGFTVMNVANNHMMQHGDIGFTETCRVLEEEGIGIVGVRGTGGFLCRPLVLDIRGMTVGILGYALEKDRYHSGLPLYAQGSDEEILSDVKKLAKISDYVIVSMHWGDEFVSRPSRKIIDLGREIVDHGAHVVIGHHPHVVQGMETYQNGTILYSLGNFIADMLWDDKLKEGIAARVLCKNRASQIDTIYISNITDDYAVHVTKNMSLHEYTAQMSKDTADDSAYEEYVEINRKNNRKKAHWYVLRNVLKYNVIIFCQILHTSLKSVCSSIACKVVNRMALAREEK